MRTWLPACGLPTFTLTKNDLIRYSVMMKFIVAANVALIAVLSIANVAAQVSIHTLDNGLKVVVKEDHRAPVVTSQVWYKVGSAQEYGGITGVSHILEHMMFKGTPSYPAGQF